ncbi:MAG TPA: hypothetical protein VL381_03525, partial [Rhodocyclaceae bacterium]|nr:hypothetical protein [Rhodocyclaceae bacterium]
DYLSKPIAQHMRDAILKEMGLTEEDVKAMPPEKRAAVEASIAEKIKERMLEAQAKNTANTVQNFGQVSLTALAFAGQQQKTRNPYE